MDACAGDYRQNTNTAATEHAVGIGDAVGAVNAATVGANVT
jgi:hypothetical protein